MKETGNIVVFITAGTNDEANGIAKHLLDQRKVACVNIVPGVKSLFWWQCKIESEEEWLLIVKTKASLLPQVIRLVKEVHSYEVPEVIAMPIIGGNEDYLKWIEDEVEG